MRFIPRAKEDTDRHLIKRYTKGWIITMSCCFVFFLCLFWFENSECRITLYNKLALLFEKFGGENGVSFENLRKKIRDLLADDMMDLIVTISTIMAAAVTFFYSIQDNRRGGIPYRSILVYQHGSWTVPTLFVLTLLMMIVNQLFVFLDWYWMLLAGSILCLAMNLSIVCVILFSASIRYGIKVVTKAEIRQFNFYIEKAKKEKGKKEEAKDNERERIIMGKHSAAYQKQHLVYVAKSDEIDVTKMQFIWSLLFVPFCSKKYNDIKKQQNDENTPAKNLVLLGYIYDYYYENLQEVFFALRDDERDKAYEVLYEFVELILDKQDACRMKYIVISAVMNAVLMCGADDAEFFCNHLLTKCIKDKEIRKKQIALYMLFQEYMYWANPQAVMLKNLKVLSDSCLGWSAEQYIEIMYEAWTVWFYNSTLPWQVSARLLCNVVETIKGISFRSVSTFYMMKQLNISTREG